MSSTLSNAVITTEYKKEVLRVAASLLLFFIVYLLLVFLAFGLAALMAIAGIQLIIFKATFVTIMIGLGMIGLGAMVAYFMIKFIFTRNKVDSSGFHQLKKHDEKVLFEFLSLLSKETGTKMPGKVFLSADVNASVFYNSSFFSMFLPVKKNLLIGLGLVNAVNKSEFKAVLSHEFGHFSQKSMKLGSFVFNINKIIHNLLFDNEAYSHTVESWSNLSGYFAIFGWLTIKIVQSFQWVLQKVYILVNVSDRSLSRQMEHQADNISAQICGPNQLINALHRIEIGDNCYQALIHYYNMWINENCKPDNVYPQHSEMIREFCKLNKLNMANGLPVIDEKFASLDSDCRVSYKNQWATHPDLKQRAAYLDTLGIAETDIEVESPWTLFSNPDAVQKTITEKVFETVEYKEMPVIMNLDAFRNKYNNENENRKYDERYNDYYSNRRITPFVIEDLSGESSFKEPHQLFNENNCSLLKKFKRTQVELELLNNLNAPESGIKTIDFCGKKYRKSEIPGIIDQITEESEQLQNTIDTNDREICRFYIGIAANGNREKLVDAYNEYFRSEKENDSAVKLYREIALAISPVFERQMSLIEARAIIDQVKVQEETIKTEIRKYLTEASDNGYIPEYQIKKLHEFLNKDNGYLVGSSFQQHELNELNEMLNTFLSLMSEREFRYKLKLLQVQTETENMVNN